MPAAFWAATAAGLVVGVPVTFQLVPDNTWYVVVGAAGTLLSLAVVAHGRLADRRACCTQELDGDPLASAARRTSAGQLLASSARETASVTGWVAVAFVITALLTEGLGLDPSRLLTVAGVFGVLAGALVGLIPGCAPQVLLTGLYASGGLPVATLVANAVSQDGDALFPLLMSDRRAALLASALTTVPALLVGIGVLLLW